MNKQIKSHIKNPKKYFCQYCPSGFTRKDNLDRHQQNGCKSIKLKTIEPPINYQKIQYGEKAIEESRDCHFAENSRKDEATLIQYLRNNKEMMVTFEKEINELKDAKQRTEKQLEELKHKPSNVVNNNLQIVCVGDKDNYLDMLTEEYGNFDKALEYIKDCALSNLSGDCKLIERIYLNNSEQKAIRYTDKNRTKVEYFNENEEKVIDTKEVFGRKIANNLQNSYLKGVNHLINENLENRRCPNKFLEEYDLQMWNQHIYSLSDLKYQKKIMNQLEIPIN